MPNSIPDWHDYLLARLLAHRAAHPAFTFAPRRVDGARFKAGYWFQGTERYLFCAPFKFNEPHNMTKTIGLVLRFDKGELTGIQYDVVFRAPKCQEHLPLYREVLKLFGVEFQDNRWQYFIPAQGSIDTVIEDFCSRLVPAMTMLIREFGLEDQYLVRDAELERALEKISARKKLGLVALTGAAQLPDAGEDDDAGLAERFGPSPRNVIFHGPPGTGKTRTLVEDVLPAYLGEAEREPDQANMRSALRPATVERFEFVTFHPSSSYEDLVEGLRPVRVEHEDGSSTIDIVPRDGALKRICKRAKDDPDNRYALVIDEINRGNIAKIFGELITLVEADKRVRYDQSGRRIAGIEVTLPCTGERFGVPANVDFYGTMNTSDRSIALVDLALRRRFLFRAVLPDPTVIAGADGEGLIEADDGDAPIDLRRLLRVLNARLTVLRGPDTCIGHAYFTAIEDIDALRAAFRDRIIPLLQEYFFDDLEGVARVLTVRKGAVPFVRAITPQVGALFGPSADLDDVDEQPVWQVTRDMPADAFRALYDGVPDSALQLG